MAADAHLASRPGPLETRVNLILQGRITCEWCIKGAPHHTNSDTSIGGSDRHTIWDIHAVEDTGGVGLRECTDAWRFDPRLAR